jgi:glucose/mannose-6-phosphate isomerase
MGTPDMFNLIAGFPQQLQKALDLGRTIIAPQPSQEIRNIVVAGMGGSGIGANIVENLVRNELQLPYQITKTYTVPASVTKHTLFIACSFSGGTEETLTALAKAEERGATIFAITSGETLLDIAKQKGYGHVVLPNEAPCPRAFLGYSLVQLLFTLHKFGYIGNSFEQPLEASIAYLQNEQANLQNEAKEIASHLKNRQVVLYADQHLEPVLVRLQQQINENSKQLCHLNVVPEMNHNELVGWGLPAEHYQNIALIWVRHADEHPRISKRIEICQTRLNAKAGKALEIHAKGETAVACILHLIHLFDWVSFYLAEENQVDAFEIEPIIYLKNELAKF